MLVIDVALSPKVVATCAGAFIPVSTLMMGLRVYARRQQKSGFASDDWVMVPAYILLIGMCITMLIELDKHMIGYPPLNSMPEQSNVFGYLASWPYELLHIPMLGLLKISIVLFYRRVFNTGSTPVHHWSTIIMIVLVAGWAISYFFAVLFICGPRPSSYWQSPEIQQENCVHVPALHLSFAATDTLFDFLILVMALPMIWGLQMSTSRKLAVTGIFGLGVITVIASVTRLIVFAQATMLRFDPLPDLNMLTTSVMYWSMLEAGLGFLAANLVIAYVLLMRWVTMLGFGSMRLCFWRKGDRGSSLDSYTQRLHTTKNMSDIVSWANHYYTNTFSRPIYPNSAPHYRESFRPTNHTDIYSDGNEPPVQPAPSARNKRPKHMEEGFGQPYRHDRQIHMETAIEIRQSDPPAKAYV